MEHLKTWEKVSAESVGMNEQKLKELDSALNFQLGIVKGVTVLRKGQNVFEKYFKGVAPETSIDMTSVTQCIMSALIGIAIDKGYIKSVDDKVIDYFPEAAAKGSVFLKHSLTIENLLTMTTSYAWKKKEPLDRLRKQKDWHNFILSMVALKGKDGEISYNLSTSHLLSVILTKATGVSAREFANEHLFRPIGMREIPDQTMKSYSKDNIFGKSITGWIKDPQGYNTGGWGLTLALRDMARFGQLYLNKGKWGEQQIISQEWIESSIMQKTEDFGYLWWLRQDNDIKTYLAAGIGGTYIYCIPEKEIVVAIASEMSKMIIDRWEIIEEYVLPAVEK